VRSNCLNERQWQEGTTKPDNTLLLPHQPNQSSNGAALLAARGGGSVDFFGLTDLEQVGSYRLTPPPPGTDPPTLTCVDAGPDASTPVLLACGTAGGSLVVVGLPLIHFLRELESANTFAAALLQSLPVKLVKDTVNMAFHTLGRVRGMASTAKGVATEALGEAKAIAKDLRRKGITGVIGGLFGKGGNGNG